jgi:hypothetical protein
VTRNWRYAIFALVLLWLALDFPGAILKMLVLGFVVLAVMLIAAAFGSLPSPPALDDEDECGEEDDGDEPPSQAPGMR